MISQSNKLHRARRAKNDEFYTRMCDIESECANYEAHFFNKIIYCNCDTEDSNFVKYFKKLKSQGKIKDVLHTGGLGGMDFRSPEAIKLLNQADIVVSNPPFSLFREYIAQLIEHDKKFLIIGNKSAIAYREIFAFVKANKLWAGVRRWVGGMDFVVPQDSDNFIRIEDGAKIKDVPAIWITNLDHGKRPGNLSLSKTYNAADYPKYENSNAINVNRTADIPADYYGVMGVPITFLERYNPAQFTLLGLDTDFTQDRKGAIIDGRRLYTRIFIQRKDKKPCIFRTKILCCFPRGKSKYVQENQILCAFNSCRDKHIV